ncbi:MAG: spondin domain-containing protein [Dysgonomonas sp.]|nr:spondin domain-containing protein [Dysgonomonas sp.]
MKKRTLPLLLLAAVSAMLVSCNSEGEKRTITFKNNSSVKDYAQSGTFQEPGSNVEVMPGQEIQITFNAMKGQTLMFATMYGNSWDLFFAPENPGIKLFEDNGNPITGDISNQVKLWDAGTKKNNDPRRSKKGQPREDKDQQVTEINGKDGTYDYPSAGEMMKLNLAYDAAASRFTLTIRNNTNATKVQTPFSTGVWAVSNAFDGKPVNEKPLFDAGEKAGTELVALAERGNNQPLGDKLAANTGAFTALSPVIVVVYKGDRNPLTATIANEMNSNTQEWAQSGNLDNLKKAMENNPDVKSVHTTSSFTKPGETAETSYNARQGEKIAFAAMIGHSSIMQNNTPVDALQRNNITADVSISGNDMPRAEQLIEVSIK